ncbi:SusE domain-containing protein [Lutibacter sp.]|uniref:SusE domain-containing protein n=1 Tax=Lutibacter sp. TaxID=1925666 RepID=UPI00273616A5|nr:SusE domain-containing protein [Lutibacter sp.]MDP3312461.1 SusE domain-containing protein [Lutibacter sp.]
MKNIFKVLLLLLATVTLVSCDNEDSVQLTLSPQGSGEITTPSSGSKYILNPAESQLNPVLTINWNPSEYGTPTEIKYVVEVAKAGTSFAAPFKAASTSNRFVTWNIGELNNIAVTAGLSPFTEGGLEIRILSTVGATKSLLQTSAAVTVFITTFTTDLPTIAVPGNHQGWDPATAPLLAASGFGKTDYEGYVWLNGEFKFLAPDKAGKFFWGNKDWGDDGTKTGKLIDKDGENNANATVAGYYFVKADTEKLTYSIQAVSWGIIGAATPTGWDSDTDLTYDSATKTLFVDIRLENGKGWKFRGNNEWGAFEFGSLNKDGFIQAGGDFIFDRPTGNYRVVLDLRNPRKYTYTITAK